MIFGVVVGMLFAAAAGFIGGFIVFGLMDLTDKVSARPKRFFPGEPDPPVYEGPNWDLPGARRESD